MRWDVELIKWRQERSCYGDDFGLEYQSDIKHNVGGVKGEYNGQREQIKMD